ncbi:hypothetical protein KXD40_007904 [Peronospora effusa]|nr:hypothetical protein KXD40_007904 [Peronospora effusa]
MIRFTALSMEFFDRVEIAMKPLHPPINDEFQLQRDANGGELVIRTNAQEFKIKVLTSKQQIELLSPASCLRTYHWNAMTKRWEDVLQQVSVVLHLINDSCRCVLQADSHDIEGLLTRDLMRFCAGIPLF